MELPLPQAGVLRGRTHVLPVRVYYEDTDAAGIVYHANYLRYAERGRTEMLRAAGVELARLREEHGLVFVVHKGEMRYLKPARLDEMLTVETVLADVGGASVKVRQVISRQEAPPVALVRFDAHVACMDADGRPVRFPAALKERLKDLVSD